jgi:hypothetical protein
VDLNFSPGNLKEHSSAHLAWSNHETVTNSILVAAFSWEMIHKISKEMFDSIIECAPTFPGCRREILACLSAKLNGNSNPPYRHRMLWSKNGRQIGWNRGIRRRRRTDDPHQEIGPSAGVPFSHQNPLPTNGIRCNSLQMLTREALPSECNDSDGSTTFCRWRIRE